MSSKRSRTGNTTTSGKRRRGAHPGGYRKRRDGYDARKEERTRYGREETFQDRYTVHGIEMQKCGGGRRVIRRRSE